MQPNRSSANRGLLMAVRVTRPVGYRGVNTRQAWGGRSSPISPTPKQCAACVVATDTADSGFIKCRPSPNTGSIEAAPGTGLSMTGRLACSWRGLGTQSAIYLGRWSHRYSHQSTNLARQSCVMIRSRSHQGPRQRKLPPNGDALTHKRVLGVNQWAKMRRVSPAAVR